MFGRCSTAVYSVHTLPKPPRISLFNNNIVLKALLMSNFRITKSDRCLILDKKERAACTTVSQPRGVATPSWVGLSLEATETAMGPAITLLARCRKVR